ncbi:MAG TPA: TadE/TadG family type IV pilus assembly protein [Longimicrobiales bacterium]
MSTLHSSKPAHRRWRNRSGQGLVEFALIAPMLLLLFFGLIEFARAWNIRHVLTDAAREGARNLALYNTSVSHDSVMQVIHNRLANSGIDTVAANVTLDDSGAQTGLPASVTITYDHAVVIPFLNVMIGNNGILNIGTTFVMRNE